MDVHSDTADTVVEALLGCGRRVPVSRLCFRGTEYARFLPLLRRGGIALVEVDIAACTPDEARRLLDAVAEAGGVESALVSAVHTSSELHEALTQGGPLVDAVARLARRVRGLSLQRLPEATVSVVLGACCDTVESLTICLRCGDVDSLLALAPRMAALRSLAVDGPGAQLVPDDLGTRFPRLERLVSSNMAAIEHFVRHGEHCNAISYRGPRLAELLAAASKREMRHLQVPVHADGDMAAVVDFLAESAGLRTLRLGIAVFVSADALRAVLPRLTCLEAVDLGGAGLPSGVLARLVGQNPSLEEVVACVGEGEANELLAACARLKSLKRVSIQTASGHACSPLDAAALCEWIASHPGPIESIVLGGSWIPMMFPDANASAAVRSAIARNRTIRHCLIRCAVVMEGFAYNNDLDYIERNSRFQTADYVADNWRELFPRTMIRDVAGEIVRMLWPPMAREIHSGRREHRPVE